MEWISFGMITQNKRSICSIDPTRFEKLLGFAPSPQATDMENAMPPTYGQHHAYAEDDMSDITEGDVWGNNDDDTSSFDDDENAVPLSKQWPDSETGSEFSALFDEGTGKSRVASIFSPSQFSPVIMSDREAMRGQSFDSSHIMSSECCVHDIVGTSTRNDFLHSNNSFLPGYGPKSAPLEVPVWSKLRAMMNGTSFWGVDVNDDDDDDSVMRIPPHELLAMQHARSQISAFSVIEGTGRTLKGRDVSRVRDAVWKQTGFSG